MILDQFGRPYGDEVSARRPSGHILIDGMQVADTVQCCHCARHFTVRRGSGTRRGWCSRCGAVTCGLAKCHACKPAEWQLDRAERIV